MLYGYFVLVVHRNDMKMEMMGCKMSIDILSIANYSTEAKETFFLGGGVENINRYL